MQEQTQTARTLSLEEFLGWLDAHLGCIVRAGTVDLMVNDHEDHHWRLGADGADRWLVQTLRGKVAIAEMIIVTSDVSFVQVQTGEHPDEWFFDLCSADGQVLQYFVMAHDFDGAESERVTHWN